MDSNHGSSIEVTHTSPASAFESVLTQRFIAGEFTHVETFRLYSPATWDQVFGAFTNEKTGIAVVASSSSSFGTRALMERDNKGSRSAAALGRDSDDEWMLTVAANSPEETTRWVEALKALLPEYPEASDETRTPVAFWAQHPMTLGATSRTRYIHGQEFGEIEANYPGEVRSQVNHVMGLERPDGLGKLMLFHGPPGTGKTRSILSLFRSWSQWCDLSVVTDPERLAGDATYLNDLLFGVDTEKNWLLLVVEDGDNFVNVDSRESKGEAIGRLLNVADGIMGQGLNVLTLISTNVKVEKLNDAMARPGRCMANIYFRPFSGAEAVEWITQQGFDQDESAERLQGLAVAKYGTAWEAAAETPMDFTLAELYAAIR